MCHEELIGQSLEGFTIEEQTEIYRVDKNGNTKESIGFLKDETIAKGLAQVMEASEFCKTRKAVILTNGEVGYAFKNEHIHLYSDKEGMLRVRKAALGKLTPQEITILGLKEEEEEDYPLT